MLWEPSGWSRRLGLFLLGSLKNISLPPVGKVGEKMGEKK